MPVNITVVHGREFLNPKTEGEYDPERVKEVIDRIASAISLNKDCDVLMDDRRSEGRFTIGEIKDLANHFASHSEFIGRKLAILGKSDPRDREDGEIFVKLIRERGFLVKRFEDYESAMSWLMPSSEVNI